jgi:flagellar hook protein FlgE
MLQGNGMFAGQDDNGALRYSRAGDFEFNADGLLVNRSNGMKVLGRDAEGKVAPISIASLRHSTPKASTEVVLTGNLSSTGTSHAIDSVVIYDKLGGAHTLRLDLKSQSETKAGSWLVTVYEGSTEVGKGDLQFDNGLPAPGTSPLALQLALTGTGTEPASVNLVLGSDVTGYSSGTTSTLAFKSQDGRAPGEVSTLSFGEDGVLKIAYSNGESVSGPRLVFAQLANESGLRAVGDSLFAYDGTEPPVLRDAGSDLKVASQTLEMSNVDLTGEFSTLILVQRGYQASSQVLSTANDMLQELFEMKGRR